MKIRFVPAQPHCFAYGGFDIQMHRTLDVLQALGVDARPLDFWSRDGDFDIIHFWGFDATHLLAARFARRYGKKIVLTPLVQYLTPRARLRYLGAWLKGAARDRIALGKLVDRFLIVNELQGDTLRALYGVQQAKLDVIPTMLDDHFFDPAPRFDAVPDGFTSFLICAGNICARKNQLGLAEAAIAANAPILFAGDLVGGEEGYCDAFARLIAPYPFLRWNKWMAGPELQRAYRAAIGVVLPSFEEQQPTVGLEAAALGKPLMLGDRPYARQKFYRNAFLARPESVSHIVAGLKALVDEPARYTPPHDVIQECRADRVANKLRVIYGSLL
ncbi:MAG TPA: glycosyltransferase family 4 protein [Rhizomicrobium sp.]|jgi:glycosyltransferase involved in cell wall biosynthesis